MSNKMTLERFLQIDELFGLPDDRDVNWRSITKELLDEITRAQHIVSAATELIRTTRFVCPDCAENLCEDVECKCPTYDERAEAAMNELEFALTRAGEL